MGIFSWLFGAPKEEEAAERVLPPGIEAPASTEEEIVFESKYKYFTVPDNVDSKQLLTVYNECIADIRTAKDPKWITKINYCALKCINALVKYYLKMANIACNRNENYLIFYVLKTGLSPIDLSALTVPEAERISKIIKMITSINIPEELKSFKVIHELSAEGFSIKDVDIMQLNHDAIVKINDFFRIYKEILPLLSAGIKSPAYETIFGGYEEECFRISEFIKKSEERLTIAEHAAGSDIEIFHEEYLCHTTRTGTIVELSKSRMFFQRDVYFCLNEIHSEGPTLIFSVADILRETKERNLNFAFALTPNYDVKLYFIPKYNLFYDKDQKKYFTFEETKTFMKNDRWNAIIYTEDVKALEKLRLRSPAVFIASDKNFEEIKDRFPGERIGKQYPFFEIKIVPGGQENPERRMFVSNKDAGYYLLKTSEGRQILKSMLPRR